MSQKLVGVDIGQSEIKVVRLNRKFSSIELHDSTLVKLNGAADLTFEERVKNGINRISSEKKLGGDFVTVSLPGDHYSIRKISLPFEDEKKIEQTLPFEVESHLPFSVEEIVVDHYVIKKENGKTELLAAVMLKSEVEKYLNLLESTGVDTTTITLAPFAIFNYYLYLSEQFGDTLIIDIGKRSSIIVTVEHGKLTGFRTIPYGSERLTDPDDENKDSFDHIIRDIYLTINSLQKDIKSKKVFLGGIEIAGLKEKLNFDFIELGDVLNGKKSLKSIEDNMHVSCGLALSQVLGEKGAVLNFRKDDLSHQKEADDKKTLFINIIFAIIILFTAGVADIYVKSYHMENKAELLKAEVRKKFSDNIPNAGKIVNEVNQMKVALGKLEKKKKLLGGRTSGIVTIMKKISESIEVVIDVEEFSMDGASLSLLAMTGSFEDVDNIRASLSKIEDFKDVKITDAKASASAGKIKFKVLVTLWEGL